MSKLWSVIPAGARERAEPGPSPTRGPWVPDIRWRKFRDDILEQLHAGIASLQLRADY